MTSLMQDNATYDGPKAALPSKMLIDGELVEALSGKRFDVEDPATGEIITTMPLGDKVDIDLAVQAARRTFEAGDWHARKYSERQEIMLRWADLVVQHAEELSEIEVRDNGMPLTLARMMVSTGLSSIRHFAGMVGKVYGRTAELSGNGLDLHTYTIKEPVGVAGVITPWNGPFPSAANKAATALAAGCSVVLKPAENTPLTAVRLAELALEAGVPKGVFNVVTGLGSTAGEALVQHPDVDVIHFTGSTAVGKHLVRTVAADLKRIYLELGGKSPAFVFDDADVDQAVHAAAMGIFRNSGQICFAASRLYVQDKIFDRVVAAVTEFAESMRVGQGFEPGVDLGPLVSEKQRARVLGYVDGGRREGGEVVTGGNQLPGPGYFMQPTVFIGTHEDMTIMREEIFGPILAICRFRDMEDLVAIGNATSYGLGAGIYTTNLSTAHRAAKALRAGNIWVNTYGMIDKAMPFGGYKQSGWGREGGIEGIEAFIEQKTVYIRL